MINWLKKKKQERRKRIQLEEQRSQRSADRAAKMQNAKHEQWRQNAHESLRVKTSLMISKPCPINKGLCSDKCVHFERGNVRFSMYLRSICENPYVANAPRCKLWRPNYEH